MNRAANVEHECTVASVKQTQTLTIKPKMKGVTTEIDTTKKRWYSKVKETNRVNSNCKNVEQVEYCIRIFVI